MAKHWIGRALAGLSLLMAAPLWAAPLSAAEDPLEGDLRDLRVGIRVEALPGEGYEGFACGANGGEPGLEIGGWREFSHCPAEPSGLHEVAFRFDDDANPWSKVSDRWEGTKVAGHPVIASLLIDDAGIVQAMRMVTDSDSRPYLRKKAFLMPIRIMGRYGREGWQCEDHPPAEGRGPIGGMFIDRHCEKTFHDRRLVVDTSLFRRADQTDKDYTNATRFEIRKRAAE